MKPPKRACLQVVCEVRVMPADKVWPGQRSAWRRLWTLLLAKGDGATSGELAPREDAGNGHPTIPQDDPPHKMLSKTTVDALRAQGWSYRAIAAELGSNYSAVYRLARATPTNGARTDATISNHVIVQSRTPDELATDVEAMKQQLTVLTSFMAAMQARNGACTAHALHGAEQNLGQRFPEAADRQPERWNLYVPKGLRRLIETQAQALGIAPSKRVVSLLLSALTAEGSDG